MPNKSLIKKTIRVILINMVKCLLNNEGKLNFKISQLIHFKR